MGTAGLLLALIPHLAFASDGVPKIDGKPHLASAVDPNDLKVGDILIYTGENNKRYGRRPSRLTFYKKQEVEVVSISTTSLPSTRADQIRPRTGRVFPSTT